MLDAIKNEFFEGKIKTQNLETEVFVRAYKSDPAKVKEACLAAERIRCEFLEKKTGKSLARIKEAHIDTCTLKEGGVILSGIESKIGGAILPMGFAGPAVPSQGDRFGRELFPIMGMIPRSIRLQNPDG